MPQLSRVLGQAPRGAGPGGWSSGLARRFQALAPATPRLAMEAPRRSDTTLLLCGDVMTGQGIDPLRPPDPEHLTARSMVSALDYVHRADATGSAPAGAEPLPRPVCFAYPWGDALTLLRREQPDLRLVNLEASITARGTPSAMPVQPRMPPQQLPALAALGVDGVVLANHHVLEWGQEGLDDTLQCLRQAGIAGVGAGHDLAEAEQEGQWLLPGKARVRLFAFAHPSSGVAPDWAAGKGRAGISWLQALDEQAITRLAGRTREGRREGDIVVVSLHWGSHWGYEVSAEQRRFAHALIDEAGVDLVWGHASRHPRPIEVYRGRLILYGVGSFLKDAGGATGHEALRPELAALYLPRLAADGALAGLRLWPLRVHLFRLKRACASDSQWLAAALGRACRGHGCNLQPQPDGSLRLVWR